MRRLAMATSLHHCFKSVKRSEIPYPNLTDTAITAQGIVPRSSDQLCLNVDCVIHIPCDVARH